MDEQQTEEGDNHAQCPRQGQGAAPAIALGKDRCQDRSQTSSQVHASRQHSPPSAKLGWLKPLRQREAEQAWLRGHTGAASMAGLETHITGPRERVLLLGSQVLHLPPDPTTLRLLKYPDSSRNWQGCLRSLLWVGWEGCVETCSQVFTRYPAPPEAGLSDVLTFLRIFPQGGQPSPCARPLRNQRAAKADTVELQEKTTLTRPTRSSPEEKSQRALI